MKHFVSLFLVATVSMSVTACGYDARQTVVTDEVEDKTVATDIELESESQDSAEADGEAESDQEAETDSQEEAESFSGGKVSVDLFDRALESVEVDKGDDSTFYRYNTRFSGGDSHFFDRLLHK